MSQLTSGTTADLTFDLASVLPTSRTKPLERVTRILDTHLPGFFEAAKPLSGVEASSFHFVKGVMRDGSSEIPAYLNAKSQGENPSISKAENLAIVSGICLFGGGSIQAYGHDGEPTSLARPGVAADIDAPVIVDVRHDTSNQIYTPESVARLTRTIAAITHVAEKHHKTTSVFMHLPSAEYKIMAEATHASGKMTAEVLRQYFALIDAEVADIQTQFSVKFREAGLPLPEFGSPLDSIIASYEPGDLRPEHFKGTPYEHIAQSITSQAMKEVGHASEVVAYQRAVQPGNLPIYVDNHRQAKIFNVAKETPEFRGIAIYPLPMCISKQSHDLMRHRGASKQQIARAVAPWQ